MDLETVDIEVINETGIEQGTYPTASKLSSGSKSTVLGSWLHRDISHSDECGAGSL